MAAENIAVGRAARTESGHKPEGKRHPAEVGIDPLAAQHSAAALDTDPAAEERHSAALQREVEHSGKADFVPGAGLSTHRTED
ncbi:MAG TPA: hypothetical protein VHS13_07730 [Edaphobacter sp.]|nr:hypothetical protein [Edaphobacter sp.]